MGFSYRKRPKLNKRSYLNVSKKGVSISTRIGPVTLNSRGRGSIRLGNGISYRFGK